MISRIGLSTLLLPLAIGGAQEVPVKSLGAPEFEHAGPWTQIAGVRELRDGRVVVLDKREQAVRLVDMRSGTMTMIGRKGPGPGEYSLPLRLIALPGDSSAIFDMANTAAPMVITPQGTAGGVLPGLGSQTGPGFVSLESETDRRGRIYTLAGYRGPDGMFAIERLDRAMGRRDTVAFISRLIVSPLVTPAPANARGRGDPRGGPSAGAFPPFASYEQWAVAPEGRVALVHPDPYRVTFIADNGQRTSGPAIPVERIRVTEAEKTRLRDERQQPVASLIWNSGGQTTAQYTRPRYVEPERWPEYLPAFLPHALSFAPDGMLWVQRAEAATAVPWIDVIGRDGRVAYRVTLPKRTRLIGFGASTVYLVWLDDDDVEHLQRYHLPR